MKAKRIFFVKNVSEPSNPPDELAEYVSTHPFRTNHSSFSFESSESDRFFHFIYMIRIRFFGHGELIQNGLGTAQ